jgi:hypothetical protein
MYRFPIDMVTDTLLVLPIWRASRAERGSDRLPLALSNFFHPSTTVFYARCLHLKSLDLFHDAGQLVSVEGNSKLEIERTIEFTPYVGRPGDSLVFILSLKCVSVLDTLEYLSQRDMWSYSKNHGFAKDLLGRNLVRKMRMKFTLQHGLSPRTWSSTMPCASITYRYHRQPLLVKKHSIPAQHEQRKPTEKKKKSKPTFCLRKTSPLFPEIRL